MTESEDGLGRFKLSELRRVFKDDAPVVVGVLEQLELCYLCDDSSGGESVSQVTSRTD